MPLVPARTRVHRRHEQEVGGERHAAGRARDVDDAVLERLAQDVERAALEFRHLVEQQHAVMRQADLAGPGLWAAADERGRRDGVMRRAKRTLREQAAFGRHQSRRRVHGRRLERLFEGPRRQQSRQPPGQHRLASPRRTGEQQVVMSGGSNLEGAPRQRLTVHIGQIGPLPRATAVSVDGRRAAASSPSWSARRASISEAAPRTSTPGTRRASRTLPRGTTIIAIAAARDASAAGSTPRQGRARPSSASSPRTTARAGNAGGSCPPAARTASAIGRSKLLPALRRSAGARFTVMRCGGNSRPALRIALRTRSRLSRTLASGRPTIVNSGRPKLTSASTRTSSADTPTSAAVKVKASTRSGVASNGAGRGSRRFARKSRKTRDARRRTWRQLRARTRWPRRQNCNPCNDEGRREGALRRSMRAVVACDAARPCPTAPRACE